MLSPSFFSNMLAFFTLRKWILGLVLAGSVLVCLTVLQNISITENIDSMLPDDDSDTAQDFSWLSRSPFFSRVLVVLEGGPGTTPERLRLVAENIASKAGPPWFRPANEASTDLEPGEAVEYLLNMLPALLKESDLKRIRNKLAPEYVRRSLQKARHDLSGLEGLGMKQIVQIDPLRLRLLALEKMSHLDLFGIESGPGALAQGVFLSPDRDSALVVLEPTVPVTDSRGSQEMLGHLEEILAHNQGEGLRSFVVSGHVYAAANAEAIAKDLRVVLAVSIIGILAVFLVFLRTWQGALLYTIPAGAMLAGIAVVSAISSEVSGITIGFGAVLMGLSMDYGLHVYYALRNSPDAGRALSTVSRPIFFCWLSTAGVFSLLLLSSLPGQRQLALFTVAGLSTAMLLALIVLPVFISSGRLKATRTLYSRLRIPSPGSRGPAIVIFLGLVLGAAFCWPGIRFDGRLQSLSMVPQDLARAEQLIADSWGDVRGMAMIISEGRNLDTALTGAQRVYDYVNREQPGQRMVSLVSVLPPRSEQQEAIRAWKNIWEKQGPELKKHLEAEARTMGFAPDAFAPFFDYIFSRPEPVTIDQLRKLGLGELTEMLIWRDSHSVSVITLVPDSPEVQSLFSPEHGSLPEPPGNARLISQEKLAQDIAAALRADMSRFLLTAAVLVSVMVFVLFRNVRRSFQALVPAAAGLSSLILVAAILGLELNLYSMAGTFLVLGLGVDYGIFMASPGREKNDQGIKQAVLVAGLTTLVGFGALILAEHPALYSIGLTVLAGIAAAIPAALWVIPALEKNRRNLPEGLD